MGILEHQRLLVVTGKGGVGKSTVSAALALESAQRGLRTLVCEVNAQERVTRLLGRPEVGPNIGLVEENLWAVDVRAPEAMREYALMVLKFESIYNAVFENRLVRYFLRFVPSLQELVILGKILFHLQEKRPDGQWRFDRIVIDGPATGHAISFLSVPQVIVDTVPPGPLAREAKTMRDLLVDDAVTAVVLVSLPEEMPVNETIELAGALRARVRVKPRVAVLNGYIEPRFGEADLAALEQARELFAAAKAHRDRELRSTASRKKLDQALDMPVHPIPRLFHTSFGRPAIEEIARLLAPLTGGAR